MDAAKDPSRTIPCLYPQRPRPPTSQHPLYNDLVADVSEVNPVLKVRSLVHSPYWIAIARGLRGKEAEDLIEFIDRVSARATNSLALRKLNEERRS